LNATCRRRLSAVLGDRPRAAALRRKQQDRARASGLAHLLARRRFPGPRTRGFRARRTPPEAGS
jgi:hypothetical protein